MTRLFAAFLALALLAPQANAAGMMGPMSDYKPGNLKLGNVSINPWYSVSTAYDSNIFAVPVDQVTGVRQGGGVRSAWVTTNMLGVNFKLPVSAMHSFDGGADVTHVNFSKQPRTNDYTAWGARLGYNYTGPMGIFGRIYDGYTNTADPAFSELAGARSQRWANSLGGSLGYAPDGGRLVLGGSADHTVDKYVDGQTFGPLLNRYTQTFGANVGYRVQPKTKVFVGYRRQIIHYTVKRTASEDKNSKSHFADLGVEGVIAPKLRGLIQAGYQLRDYDQASDAIVGTRSARRSYVQAVVASSQLTWKPMDRCVWILALNRGLNESTFVTNRYSITNNANISVTHRFPYKLTANVRGGVSIDKYPESVSPTPGVAAHNRRDDTYTQGVGLSYGIREWVSIGADYQHSQRHSTASGQFNYEQHLTTLNAKLTF
ncbi:MAG: outer membrane beta-barrel protein [Elusimicrobia bacterium]|nr:outer membrane beta-barrel protein [Elusimicrobiota bacterium]